MENVISLSQRREERAHSPGQARFFFALDSPLSYLMSERIERALGDIEAALSFRAARLGERRQRPPIGT